MQKAIGIALIIIGLVSGLAAFELTDIIETTSMSVVSACMLIIGGMVLNER